MEQTITQVKPTDFLDVPYSPALLLDARFDTSITDCFRFRDACSHGFDAYFEGLYEVDGVGDMVVVDRMYTWREIERTIAENVTRRYDVLERFHGVPCLSFRAGFMLGWLSAMALVDRALAWAGVELLGVLVPSCQREEAERV